MLDIRESIICDDKKIVSDKLKIDLFEFFSSSDKNWILYLWYPLVNLRNGLEKIDALLISKSYWVFVFSLLEKPSKEILDYEENRQKELKRILTQKLLSSDLFYDENTGWLNIKISVITYSLMEYKNIFSEFQSEKWIFKKDIIQNFPFALDKESLSVRINENIEIIQDKKFEIALSLIQDIINLKPSRKRNITKTWSLWDKLNKIEEQIANLDSRQENAVISFFEWIQRIRWLAWSGKTIIIALKVALYHIMRPEAKIAVTFHSRSLKQQFKDLIENFCYSKASKKPDWGKIKIIHAWWSEKEWAWIYFNLTKKYGLNYSNFNQAKILAYNNNTTELDAICNKLYNELLSIEKNGNIIYWEYDIIFVDEAQDLSESFLKLCYKILIPTSDTNKRRLIYAYDELQKLDEGSFLSDPEGIFWEKIENVDKQDLILYKCYRNSKELITSAHWLWFWIYRNEWLVQFFDDKSLWWNIWYKSKSELISWNSVSLYRDNDSSPEYFNEYYWKNDFVKFNHFSTLEDEWKYVSNSIENDIKNEDLLPNDILVIYLSNWKDTKKLNWLISWKLFEKWIKTYYAWEDNPDIFYKDDCITIAWIYRAKWNEVWKVYIIWAENSYKWEINDAFELKKKRNALFTAITRSKWVVEICGIWENFKFLKDEHEKLIQNDYKLVFVYPSLEDINKMNTIYRSIDLKDNKNFKWEIKSAYDFINILAKIKNGKSNIEDYPEEIKLLIKQFLKDGEN